MKLKRNGRGRIASCARTACLLLSSLLGVAARQAPAMAQQMKPPTGGQVLVQSGDSKYFEVGQGAGGESRVVPVEGRDFKEAVRATVEKRGNSWDLEARVQPKARLAKGEAVLVHLWARTIETRDESGQGLLVVSLAETERPWREQFTRTFSVGAQWQQFFLRGAVKEDYQPGQLALKLRFGLATQVVEVGGVEILSYGAGFDTSTLPETRSTYAGREADAAWRVEAAARIRELRMAPLEVQVIDRAGKPVRGATAHIALQKHAFAFGCAFNPKILTDDKPENAVYRRRFLELFNAGSFTNSLKWQAWAGEWGAGLSREATLRNLEWLREHGLEIRGHVLVWPSFRNLPADMKALQGKASPAELQRLVLAHIDDVTAATAPYISEWDVINEPRDNHDLMDIIGRQVMLDYFRRARNRLPNTRLVLNDFGILSGLTEGPTQQAFEEDARYLLDNNAPLDGFGFQGHFGATVPSPPHIRKVLDRFAALDRPIRITEFTIAGDDDALKADFTRDFLTLIFSHPAVNGFQFWGFDQVVKEDGTLTALGEAYRSLVKEQWHTDVTANSDEDGMAKTDGFLGRYAITVTQGERSVTVPFDLRRNSQPLIVTLP